MESLIRRFRSNDSGELAELLRPLVLLAQVVTGEELLHRWRVVPRRARTLWLVALEGDRLVGHALVEPQIFGGGPDLRRLWVGVAQSHRGRGLGSRLFDAAVAHAVAVGVTRLKSWARADMPEGVRFLETRGFVRSATERQWTVDPSDAPLSDLDSRIQAAGAEGFTMAPLSRLASLEHPLHRLFMGADSDAPHDTGHTRVPFATWRRFILDNPVLDREGSFVALRAGEPVAFCWLLVDHVTGRAAHEFTGTARAFRHRGLARLVKLSALRWAAENGIRSIGTANDSTNRDILALNRHLGYRRGPDAFGYQRDARLSPLAGLQPLGRSRIRRGRHGERLGMCSSKMKISPLRYSLPMWLTPLCWPRSLVSR